MELIATILAVALAVSAIMLVAIAAACLWFASKTHRALMHFHTAGQGMAQHELNMAQIAVEEKRAEVDRIIAQNAAAAQEVSRKRREPDKTISVGG